jgi:hypothetical protein
MEPAQPDLQLAQLPRYRTGGKIQCSQFDVFVSHNSTSRPAVLEICDALRRHGIHPWVAMEQIRPGAWVQDSLSLAVRLSRTVVLILGPEGVGPWQMTELRMAIDRRIVEDIPLIPVLLPGTVEIPDELPYLRLLGQVRFMRSLSEEVPMCRLIWSITGEWP